MSSTTPFLHQDGPSSPASDEPTQMGRSENRPLVSLVLPAYNETAIIEKNLATLCNYMQSLETRYRWEIIIINDGSTDNTGELAESFAKKHENVRVFHHITNFGLGQAFKFGFRHCQGDYIVTFDIDLSYAPDHIEKLLTKISETRAKLVLASPYMQGGAISNVPPLRRALSKWANRFLSIVAKGHLSTLTCMVRAYDGVFIRSLSLRSTGMDIMPEEVYKAIILRGRIEQIPAHLDWSLQIAAGTARRSSMRIMRHVLSTLLSGFIFRPFMFFILPGFALFLFAAYVNTWMLIHFFEEYLSLPDATTGRFAVAVAAAYAQFPHTFIVGLFSLILAIQLLSLGVLSLQTKTYFEEMFYLGTGIYKETLTDKKKNG